MWGGWGQARHPHAGGGTPGPAPWSHPMVSMGPKGTDGIAQAWAVAVTRQMSYEQAAGGAAGGGGGHNNNGTETPGQWGPRATGATVVCCTMGHRGTAARPTAAADTACRVFKSFPGPVFLQGSQSLGQPDGHLMPAWWAEGPGPAPRSSCGHGNANCCPKTEGKRARRVRGGGVGRERGTAGQRGESTSWGGPRVAEADAPWWVPCPTRDKARGCTAFSLPLSRKPQDTYS